MGFVRRRTSSLSFQFTFILIFSVAFGVVLRLNLAFSKGEHVAGGIDSEVEALWDFHFRRITIRLNRERHGAPAHKNRAVIRVGDQRT